MSNSAVYLIFWLAVILALGLITKFYWWPRRQCDHRWTVNIPMRDENGEPIVRVLNQCCTFRHGHVGKHGSPIWGDAPGE